ncbi:MAG TPA: peroxide stress protein YaaA [Spongiibacteraceae bacterium]|nr:peroxide stress protein YaaA [Spongiibacteraceae bacterium]
MLIVISPAKTLDFETPSNTKKFTQPAFLEQSAQLIEELRQLDPPQIGRLMNISDKLAELNHHRFMNWSIPFAPSNAKQALFAFRGDVYTGLDADSFSAADITFAQKHLRMLSGLYGVLKPLDLMQPYRLEMGTALRNRRGKNLYEFWDGRITAALHDELVDSRSKVLINLASEEYFKAVHPKALATEVITPIFKERKGDGYKIVSFFAKKARGLMAAYIVKQRLRHSEAIKDFALAGYRYDPRLSSGNDWVFTREADA